ncbi:MAG TPA: hypothetical protein VGE21_16500 [Flavobacteriales bacterium]
MTVEPTFHEARLAVVERHRPDILIVRYRDGITFESGGLAELVELCERIAGREQFGVISVLPENGETSLDAMQNEHSTDSFGKRVRAHAVVVTTEMFRRLAEIHYNYHPQQHEVRQFGTVVDALEWVQVRLGDRSVA